MSRHLVDKPVAEPVAASGPAVLVMSDIVSVDESGRFVLRDGTTAYRAVGCLVEPHPGDRVLYAQSGEMASYVIDVLARTDPMAATVVSTADNRTLAIDTARLHIRTRDEALISSLGSLRLEAPLGKISVEARDVLVTAAASLVAVARIAITKAVDIAMDAAGLVNSRARHQVMTAEKEVKIDGEHIHMG